MDLLISGNVSKYKLVQELLNEYPTDLEILAAELEVAEAEAQKYREAVQALEEYANQPVDAHNARERSAAGRRLSEAKTRYWQALNWVTTTMTKKMLLEEPEITTDETPAEELEAYRKRRDGVPTDGTADNEAEKDTPQCPPISTTPAAVKPKPSKLSPSSPCPSTRVTWSTPGDKSKITSATSAAKRTTTRQPRVVEDDDWVPVSEQRQDARLPVGFHQGLFDYLMGRCDPSTVGEFNNRHLRSVWEMVREHPDKPPDWEKRFMQIQSR